MRADYDSKANAISITLVPVEHAERGGHRVELQLLYPDLGIEEPIAAVAGRYDLDRGALEAAARSALFTIETRAVRGVRLSRAESSEVPAHRRVSMTRHDWRVLAVDGG